MASPKRKPLPRYEERMPPDVPDIFRAAETNDVAKLKVALEHYDVNSRDASGMTPLHYAASTLSEAAVIHLLAQPDVDATLPDRYGRSAATLAAESWPVSSQRIVSILMPRCYPWIYSEEPEPEAPA